LAAGAQTSDNITLDIKGMDILDVLKILSMKSGLNIVAGKNVTGKVTIFLKDVNVWDALQIILVANNLAYEKQGGIINVMTDKDYELIYGEKYYDKKKVYIARLKYVKAADASKALLQAKTSIGKVIADDGSNTIVMMDTPSSILQMKEMLDEIDTPTQTKVFPLKYAKADDVEKKVAELVTKNVGFIKIDARTNKIAVTDTPEQLEKIEKVITAFDQKDAQVMIEAKILEVTLNNNYQMGIDWTVIANKFFSASQTLKLGLTQGGNIKVGTLVGPSGAVAANPGKYSGLIDALKEVGVVNILSTPKIMALNNQESKILIGTKQPYSTQSAVVNSQTTTTAESVTFVDLGVKLYVTPTINEDGYITMKIKPEVSSKTGDYMTADKNTIPIISTTEAETTIMVKDGATVVIAGLIKDSVNKNSKKIPFLGSIPLLGKIFSNESNIRQKDEIIVLLTPHITTGESIFTETERWRRQESLMDALKDKVEEEDLKIKQARQREELLKSRMEEKEKAKEKAKAKTLTPAAVNQASVPQEPDSDYFQVIKNKIQDVAAANVSQTGLKGDCTVKFTLDSGGNLIGQPVIIKESSKSVGDLLLESVKSASPFGSFPEEFDTQSESFTVSVSFQ